MDRLSVEPTSSQATCPNILPHNSAAFTKRFSDCLKYSSSMCLLVYNRRHLLKIFAGKARSRTPDTERCEEIQHAIPAERGKQIITLTYM